MSSLSPHAIELLEHLIRHEVEDKAIPSISYALIDRDGLMAHGHIQRHDRHFDMKDDTCFRIGSITKTFTSVAIMQLVEKGLVDLDVDVSEYLPGFHPVNPFAGRESGPHGSQISLAKLMSHTAGIVREPKSGHYLDSHKPPLADTVAELATSTLKQDPSAGIMHYSNAGIAVVGMVIERVTRKSYADYITENILMPLGMNDTSSGMAPGIRERLAPADMWTLDGDSPAPVFNLGGSPAGNIFSTTSDMANYTRCLLRGGFAPNGDSIVSPASLRKMWTPIGKRPEGHNKDLNGYGLCFGVGDMDGWTSVGHGGAVYGYASQMMLLPRAGFGVLIFATLDFANQIASRLAGDGLRIALADCGMGRMPLRGQAPPPITEDQFASLPGLYRHEAGGEVVEVKNKDGKLYLMGEGVPLQIRPVSGNDFVIDGRIYGRGADYAHMNLSFSKANQLDWKGATWSRVDSLPVEKVPPEIAPHLGEYGPDFNITYLTYSHGQLKCLIEYFCTHSCEPVDAGRFRMHGLLYEEEILELGAVDDNGRRGIRVGPMFLERRQAEMAA
ncbi:serine hydrolase domain-containing protein [Mesorhizobium sp. M8A.F.Ca.ET.165.01.1.1]|uniref:serine hydrolase domain-containing protein n=1 Tax=Mesorhizobium sp. M8A.F.Ca.ET.165.01.1.1 TaxID=2563960 RepID=UPI001093A34F|nr:serine hydrolase domain-containing protein [Mesorhizobium sp. M8A.F.Ca.ET.165.01.1.1]TGT40220.1 class A beta-lactamase-related serine hydrolase [Mesorhizobium sp. M8A.F.Ca.ET.165.01.1.1]